MVSSTIFWTPIIYPEHHAGAAEPEKKKKKRKHVEESGADAAEAKEDAERECTIPPAHSVI